MCASKLLTLSLAALLAAGPVLAADKKADGNKEARRLQQALSRVEKEKGQLAQEKGALETELGETRKKAEEEGKTLRRQLDGARSARETLTAKLAETEEQLKITRERLATAESEGKRLDGQVKQRTSELGQCRGENEKLFQEGSRILEHYERKGCFEAMLQAEPFTGLKRVEIENYREDSHEKLEEHRLGK